MKIASKGKWVSLLLLGILLVLSAALVVGCGGDDATTAPTAASGTTSGAAAPSGDPVVIGAIVSATGPGSALGEQERNVLEMMEEQVNARGGILGRPVKIVIEDDKSDPKEAVTAANRLIQQEKAVALIAATISSSTLAVKEIAAQKGLPQMAMAAANDITDKAPAEWIWRTPHKDALAAARALTYVAEDLQVKKVAVIHDENAFGSSGSAESQKSAPGLGLEIVAVESYKTNATQLTAQLTNQGSSLRSSSSRARTRVGTGGEDMKQLA
jgi:branched-chain amino acid transport system substrate-binding protein